MLRSPARRLRAPLLAALALGVAAGPASAATVTSGKLDWTTTKVYDTGAPAGTDRTWLGYVTSPFPLANGTAEPGDGATGDTVTTATASGTDATWSFPTTSGDYEPADGTGEIRFDGTVTFTSPPAGAPPNGGHGFTVSLTDPRVVLDGDSGHLFASGISSTGTYTDAQPVFDLDLSTATVTLHANGSRTIAGIVPAIATAELAFPSQYSAGAGPDRTPNTFGSFSLRVKTAPVAGPKGDKGDRGEKGDRGDAGPRGRVVRTQISVLSKAPVPDGRRHRVAVLSRKSKRVLARGVLRARTLRVTLTDRAPRSKRLKGVYRLRVIGGPLKRIRVA